MFTRKRVAAILGLIFFISAVLTACSLRGDSTAPQSDSQRISSTKVNLPGGRTVICVFGFEGGVDCDWENAK